MFFVLFCSILIKILDFSEIQLVCDGPTDGRTDGRTDGPTDGRTNPLTEMRERIKKPEATGLDHEGPC